MSLLGQKRVMMIILKYKKSWHMERDLINYWLLQRRDILSNSISQTWPRWAEWTAFMDAVDHWKPEGFRDRLWESSDPRRDVGKLLVKVLILWEQVTSFLSQRGMTGWTIILPQGPSNQLWGFVLLVGDAECLLIEIVEGIEDRVGDRLWKGLGTHQLR